MPYATLTDAAVAVCDWNGRLIWTSRSNSTCTLAAPLWENFSAEWSETVKAAISRVVTAREPQEYEAVASDGKYYHTWLWPLNSPEIAACLLAVRIPQELARLTARERECLEWLGAGFATGAIAEKLDISVSTVHTHFKRAREKLLLPKAESLVSFAARYCYLAGIPTGLEQIAQATSALRDDSAKSAGA